MHRPGGAALPLSPPQRQPGDAAETLTGANRDDECLARLSWPVSLLLVALAAGLLTLFVSWRDHGYPGESPPNQGTDNGSPPTSGPRASHLPANFVLSTPLSPAEQVNILAYGNVLLQYNDRCDAGGACPAGTGGRDHLATDLADVAGLYNNEPVQLNLRRGHGVVVAPNYELRQGEVALTAWKRLQRLDRADRAEIERFISAWLGNRAMSDE
jgi:hypothetical protein